MEKVRLLTALILSIGLVGCATMGLVQTPLKGYAKEDIVDVRMEVFLERAFVRSSSTYGTGAIVMVMLVGPFSYNVEKLYGTIEEWEEARHKAVGSFIKGLKWGENFFNIRAPKNTEIKLMLRSGGTREGMIDIGYVSIGSESQQTVIISLTEMGVDILTDSGPPDEDSTNSLVIKESTVDG